MSYLENEYFIKCRNDRYVATDFGRKSTLLYIDPLTAVEFRKAIGALDRTTTRKNNGDNDSHTLGFLHMITTSADFYPKLSLRKKDFEELSSLIQQHGHELFYQISEYDCSRSLLALYEWIEETSDRMISNNVGVEPGDMHRMIEIGDWLAYSLYEVAKLLKREDLLTEIHHLRTRIKYGVKEELIPIVALEGIGRVRARALYDAGLTDPRKILQASNSKLSAISKIGPTVAAKLKEQLKKTEQKKSLRYKNEIDRF